MDWVHCNNCGIKPPQAKICLTSCGHLLCESCVKRTSTTNHSKCFVCEQNFQTTEVNSKMRPDLMVLFKDPREYAASLMSELRAVISFQEKQRAISSKLVEEMSNAEYEKALSIQEHHQKALKVIESAKLDLNEAYKNLAAAKDKKREMIAKIEQLRQKRAALEARVALNQEKKTVKKVRIEPKKRITPKEDVVTSTPVGNIEASRRGFMARMFSSGSVTLSPIVPK